MIVIDAGGTPAASWLDQHGRGILTPHQGVDMANDDGRLILVALAVGVQRVLGVGTLKKGRAGRVEEDERLDQVFGLGVRRVRHEVGE